MNEWWKEGVNKGYECSSKYMECYDMSMFLYSAQRNDPSINYTLEEAW